MHLCWYIAAIYRREIEKSNSLTAVNVNYSKNWLAKHVVFFSNPLDEYDDTKSNHIKKVGEKTTPHDLPARGYLCLKCGCCVLGPLDAKQKEWYAPVGIKENANEAPTITATPQNIYWEDDTPSGLFFPVWQENDNFCCAPEIHLSSMSSYYDLDAEALPGFDDAFQSFTIVADKLTEIFASESSSNDIQLITVIDIGKTVDNWQLVLPIMGHKPSQYVRESKAMTTTEKNAFQKVVEVFEFCRYGRLRYINVFNGQVSFVTVQGYTVICKQNGERPSLEHGTNFEKQQMNIEQLRENWYHGIPM